jgi:hypothetical protein
MPLGPSVVFTRSAMAMAPTKEAMRAFSPWFFVPCVCVCVCVCVCMCGVSGMGGGIGWEQQGDGGSVVVVVVVGRGASSSIGFMWPCMYWTTRRPTDRID